MRLLLINTGYDCIFDTNILVEYLEKRTYSETIGKIFALRDCEFVASSSSIYTLSYLLDAYFRKKGIFNPDKNTLLRSLLKCVLANVNIVDLDNSSLCLALENVDFIDIEDGFQYQCACKCAADVILTINDKDFVGSRILVRTPQAFLDSRN